MIKVDSLSYSFPQKDLYNNITFTIEEGQHCAFIGASGSGKSTLIDIIMDPEKYLFDGKLEMEPNLKIGYVSQFSQCDKSEETTVFEYIAQDFIKLQNEIDDICAQMGTSSDIESLLEKYQEKMGVQVEVEFIRKQFIEYKTLATDCVELLKTDSELREKADLKLCLIASKLDEIELKLCE